MHDVAPSAVRMADAIDAMICTTHFKVSFLVIRLSILLFWHGFHGFTQLFSYSAVSLRRSPWVWRQSTVACDFTSGPDPSKHSTLLWGLTPASSLRLVSRTVAGVIRWSIAGVVTTSATTSRRAAALTILRLPLCHCSSYWLQGSHVLLRRASSSRAGIGCGSPSRCRSDSVRP